MFNKYINDRFLFAHNVCLSNYADETTRYRWTFLGRLFYISFKVPVMLIKQLLNKLARAELLDINSFFALLELYYWFLNLYPKRKV